jgi:hypothetical protein
MSLSPWLMLAADIALVASLLAEHIERVEMEDWRREPGGE